MFTMPSIWNLLISIVVFMLAYFASWASGEGVDFIQEKIEGPQATTKLDLGMPIDL